MTDANNTPGFFTSIYKAGLGRGLFTQASPLSVPEGFSPAMENVYFNDRNNVRTRHGTQELLASIPTDTHLYVIRTIRAGITLVITKQSTNLVIYRALELQPGELSLQLIETFNNVWSSEVNNTSPDFAYLAAQARVVITTGRNTPVFVRIVERQQTLSNSSVINVQNPTEFTTPSQTRVFKNGVLVTTGFTITSTQVVFTTPQTGVFDLLHIGWHWCTEASVFYGFQLSQQRSRFNTGPSDLSIAIPPELLPGIEQMVTNRSRIPIAVHKNGLAGSEYIYINPPVTENQFTFSGGSFRTTANNQKILPGITHVTFGAVNASETDVSEVTFIRGIDLNEFNGGVLMQGTCYNVFADNVVSTLTTSAVAADYGTYYKASRESAATGEFPGSGTATDLITFVLLNGTSNVGLRSSTVLRTVRTTPVPQGSTHTFIGSAALAGTTLPYKITGRGTWWPMYGLHEHADFSNGSFPKFVETHENRLVLAGFALNPTRVVLSAVFDTTVRGDFYSDFQIQEQEGTDVNAVVIDINTADAGGITAIKSASGVLFAFTLNSCYLISSDGGLTPNKKFVTQVAGVGAVNSSCVVVLDSAIVFLSRNGLYTLAQSFDAAGGWRTNQLSEAINDRLDNPKNADVAWMTYLPNEGELLLGVASRGSQIADELYIWKQDLNAWTRFTDYTGYMKTIACAFTDLSQNYALLVKQGRLLSYPYYLPIDQFTGTLAVDTYSSFAVRKVQTLPYRTVPDVGVKDVGTVGLIEAVKLNGTQVFVDSDNPSGSYLYPAPIDADVPLVAVYRNTGVRRGDITFDVETGTLSSTPGATDRKGYIYKCYAVTPTLFATSDKPGSYLPSTKSVHTVYFVFHTDGEYPYFGVQLKKVDTDVTQVTPVDTYPAVDGSTTTAFDSAVMDAARQLIRPLWKIAVNAGGIDDFFQFIIMSDSVRAWELVAIQATVSQSSVRPGVGKI